MNKSRVLLILACLILVLWGNTFQIMGKALLAQYLIKSSWEQTLASNKKIPPWPWADTWPVATLAFPEHNKTLYALAGAHGSSLAFGPGHIDGTALPDEEGTQIYSAHRDTHFRFLKNITIDEQFSVQGKSGLNRHYKVVETRIVNINKGPWRFDNELDQVHLITCYPFDKPNLNPEKRFIVIAERV